MKCKKWLVAGMLILPLALRSTAGAEPLLPGQVDFGSFSPPKGGGEYVEVNVPGNLISLAARFVEKQEPDVAKLINGVKSIRVNVVGMNSDNKADLTKRVQKVRNDLSSGGWERIVTAQKEGQDVGVYLKMDEQSTIQGLTVTVIDRAKQAVFVNIVGDIRPEQLTMLGERLHIDSLKAMGPMSQPEKRDKQSRDSKEEAEEK